MSIFRTTEQEQSYDIRVHPKYASLSEDGRKAVHDRFNRVFEANQGRMGIRVAQGIAYEAAKQMCESGLKEGELDTEAPAAKEVDSKELQKKDHEVKDENAPISEENDSLIDATVKYIKYRSSVAGINESTLVESHKEILNKRGYTKYRTVPYKDNTTSSGKATEYMNNKTGHKVMVFGDGAWRSGNYKGGSWITKHGKDHTDMGSYLDSNKG